MNEEVAQEEISTPGVSGETLSRQVYAELESILPVFPGSPSAGELAEIRKWLFAENKEPETALTIVWGHGLHAAPLGLFPLIRPEMELAKMPTVAARLRRLDEGYKPTVAVDMGPVSRPATGKIEEDLLAQVYRRNRIAASRLTDEEIKAADEEIEAAVRDDPDAAPLLDKEWFSSATLVMPKEKKTS